MRVDYSKIEESTIERITDYIKYRLPPSDFLRAVLENNLSEAFGRADDDDMASMFHIVAYIYQEAPRGCWGSPERVRLWLDLSSERKE